MCRIATLGHMMTASFDLLTGTPLPQIFCGKESYAWVPFRSAVVLLGQPSSTSRDVRPLRQEDDEITKK